MATNISDLSVFFADMDQFPEFLAINAPPIAFGVLTYADVVKLPGGPAQVMNTLPAGPGMAFAHVPVFPQQRAEPARCLLANEVSHLEAKFEDYAGLNVKLGGMVGLSCGCIASLY